MKIIFDYIFIKNDFWLFLIASIITVFLISLILYLGIKEINKNVHK